MNFPLTPIRCLYRAVDLYPQKIGVICGDKRFTYAQFGARCERLAGGLLALGAKPGDRVAYLSFNTHQLLEGFFGPMLAHAIVMPLNVRLSGAELSVILNHAEVRFLVYEDEFAGLVEAFRQNCPSIQRYIGTGTLARQADMAYEDLLAHDAVPRPDIRQMNENDIAEIFYTSGSTGSPKGVALSHRTLYLHTLSNALCLPARDTSVELHTIPLFHANGWARPQTCTMMGARQVMVRRFDPQKVFELIEKERTTSMMLVPVMANALLNYQGAERFDLSSMEEVTLGGAAASPELVEQLEKLLSCRVICGYGLTEAAPVVSTSRSKAMAAHVGARERRAMAGWPIVGTEMRVIDAQGQDVPRDMQTAGEIIVRGDNLMDGYFREPEATDAVMHGGWLHTGDMAVWDAEAFVQIVDRKKDIIISGGENISSIEIEQAILANAKVLECAVVAAPDAKWGEVPAALIVLKPGESMTSDELLPYLKERLAKFKLPRVIQFEPEPLPKTGTGKILKRELRERFWHGKERRVQG